MSKARVLTVTKVQGKFCVDDMKVPGTPPAGYGRTFEEAVGNWVINNQTSLNWTFDLKDGCSATEERRRARARKER